MCGILGFFQFDAAPRPDLRSKFLRGLSLMYGRGPDGYWIYADNTCSIGQTLLSITDPEGPIRPYVSNDSGIVGCANGEIYNSADLREFLESEPVEFQSDSDCEVIAHGYARWGDRIFERLDGMFGISLLNRKDRQLILARDRVGIRPLYYAVHPDYVAFASEPRTLVSSGLASAEPSEEALYHSLVLRRALEPLTMFRDVMAVLPGQRLKFDFHGRVTSHTFGSIPPQTGVASSFHSAGYDTASIRNALTYAVHRRIPDRGKYGFFLSGGLDSSIVNLLAPSDPGRRLPSMVSGFDAPGVVDERVMAQEAANRIGVDLLARSVSLERFLDIWPFLIWEAGEPLMFNSAVPLFALCREARSMGAKVMLSGEGADEMFAGYRHYPGFASREDDGSVDYLLNGNPEVNLPGLVNSVWLGDPAWGGRQWGLLRDRLDAALPFQGKRNGLARVLEFDRMTFLRALLMRQDRVGLTTGIEIRVPFLDRRVVAEATARPANSHLDGQVGKRLLRTAFARELGSQVSGVPKVGFPVPIAAWSQSPAFRDTLLELNRSLNASGFFRKDVILNLLNAPAQADGHFRHLWTLSNWAMWWQSRVCKHTARESWSSLAAESMRAIDSRHAERLIAARGLPCVLSSRSWNAPEACQLSDLSASGRHLFPVAQALNYSMTPLSDDRS